LVETVSPDHLLGHSFLDLGMVVAQQDGPIAAQKVQVLIPVHIPIAPTTSSLSIIGAVTWQNKIGVLVTIDAPGYYPQSAAI
jgi:hypothetical protein